MASLRSNKTVKESTRGVGIPSDQSVRHGPRTEWFHRNNAHTNQRIGNAGTVDIISYPMGMLATFSDREWGMEIRFLEHLFI